MMRYTMTFLEQNYEHLREVLRQHPNVENAAYLLCRLSRTESEVRLLVREIIPIVREHLLEASSSHMKIASPSYRAAMKRADLEKCSFGFVHTHPNGYPQHSTQDDKEEAPLFRTAYVRVHSEAVHASLVFSESGVLAARVWLEDGSTRAIERIRIIGNRFRFWFSQHSAAPIPEFFDRQVRAFGPDLQRLLGRLRVGIVGAGGTGSAVIQQLTRLGVGELLIADGEQFDVSNVNRLYGSRTIDDGITKVKIAQRAVADVGLGTKITLMPKPISHRSAISAFKDCDVIFGCTDDEWGRALLSRLAIYYGIPVFDVGVRIDSEKGIVRSLHGRATTLLPGAACLFCRGRITAERVGIESLRTTNPAKAAERVREGYAPDLEDPAPAVIPFTTAVASTAVSEFLHRLTGFMGKDRNSSEVLHLFDATSVRRNSKPPRPECFCAPRKLWMRGDTRPLLDSAWRPE
jgi:molybdopterin/thiamine biosynthesis adenylyltransferase